MSAPDPGEELAFPVPGGCRYGRLWRAPEPAAVVAAVHGLESHSRWFGALAAALRHRSVTLLAFDRVGSGRDPHPRGASLGVDGWLADVGHLAAAAAPLAPPGQIHLLGHSWGAKCVAAALLLATGPAVRSALLLTPGLFPRGDLPAPTPVGLAAPADGVPIPLEDHHFTRDPAVLTFIATDPKRLRKLAPRFVIDDGHLSRRLEQGDWAAVETPLWLGLADRDRIVDEARTAAWIAALPHHTHMEIFPHAGHLVLLERADELARAIIRWLEEVM